MYHDLKSKNVLVFSRILSTNQHSSI